MFNNHVQ